MSKKIRTVRFTEEDIKLIESFLQKNYFFDFSTLARVAIRNFIENPQLQIESVSKIKNNEKKDNQYV